MRNLLILFIFLAGCASTPKQVEVIPIQQLVPIVGEFCTDGLGKVHNSLYSNDVSCK